LTTLAEIALFTDDVTRACAFYESLVGTPPISEWPGGAIFSVGDGKLLVHEKAATMSDGPPNEDHFALSVEDLDRACGALAENGAHVLVDPRDYPWGRSAYLRDPDGRLVELTQA
jgi:predicted enzyme related to lactoylglutathione lyase